jgi:DNA-binding MarR family transcriptional regulator
VTENITDEIIIEKLSGILQENEPYYYAYRNLLTEQQYSLLKAIGKQDGVAQPSSKEFITKHKLGTTSTINSAIKSLLNKELIFREGGKYKVYDVFFSLWLKLFN